MPLTADSALADAYVAECVRRGIIAIDGRGISYQLHQQKAEDWTDPEEWVRVRCVSWLILDREYPPTRMKIEVAVPRRTPADKADIVVYRDDACTDIYLVVETKAAGQRNQARRQAIEQLFGNANSFRAPFALYDESDTSVLFDVLNFPAAERERNRLGVRQNVPKQYGAAPTFALVAGGTNDIAPVSANALEAKIRRAHAIIWAGGKRDPLNAFDEWSKVLFAKVRDERATPSGEARRFQVGTGETVTAVANRVHQLFREACEEDREIFPSDVRVGLADSKVVEVVRVLQDAAFTRTDADTVGRAFEQFFGSIFRGGLGQYFTMRQLARFTVGVLNISHQDFVLDPTAGSGGFLLEALLQVWHRLDREFAGQPNEQVARLKLDFARLHVYGVEIHDILSRICKINLLLHHDGHTNIEGGRSCLDSVFTKSRLIPPASFSSIIGNPPFGDTVEAGDDDKLGSNRLENFALAAGRTKVDSEQLVLERCIEWLEPGGRLGLVLPDGLLNNQGELSNCPRTRRHLAERGKIEAIISLPDFAFRKSGAQNKTSVLFFRKFTAAEARSFSRARDELRDGGRTAADLVSRALARAGLEYKTFLAEANHIGYTTTGLSTPSNDLYRATPESTLADDQDGTILGEWRVFQAQPDTYHGRTEPDCMSVSFGELWLSHQSNRLDPKYHLFRREQARTVPAGWVKARLGDVMQRRVAIATPHADPNTRFLVLTISQTGEVRPRVAGKGNTPPDWLGIYFEDMPSTWYTARANDLVYSSIDCWKGCIAVVPPSFDGGLVTKEFPIYEVTDRRLQPQFLQCLLRSRYYQRAFRAITTGHSNRRRTQQEDFEDLEIVFPPDAEAQDQLVSRIVKARSDVASSSRRLHDSMQTLSAIIDGRGDEELPELTEPDDGGDDE